MAIVCTECGRWVNPVVDKETQTVRCTACGHVEPRRILPLFIVTGASGVGKSAVMPLLQSLLPDWEVFETDILWDSASDWNMVKCNWLRIAHSIAQAGRPTLLCGTMQPAEIARCEALPFFSRIHWLALHCDAATLAGRLRARPAWRGCTEEFIAEHQTYAQWFLDHVATAFDPPLTVLDTTNTPVAETARHIRDWVMTHWKRETAGQPPTIESLAEEPERPVSFLRTARALELNGPRDWSAKLDDYL